MHFYTDQVALLYGKDMYFTCNILSYLCFRIPIKVDDHDHESVLIFKKNIFFDYHICFVYSTLNTPYCAVKRAEKGSGRCTDCTG